jgi:hypothetical protein
VLTGLLFIMAYYWLAKFPAVWINGIFFLVEFCLLLIVLAGVGTVLKTAMIFSAKKILRRAVSPGGVARVSRISFILAMVVVFGGMLWALKMTAGRSIKISLPAWLSHSPK